MNDLAALYNNQGQYVKAEPLYVAYLEQRRRITLGETHPDTLSSMNDLAFHYRNKGQYAKAELLHAVCLEKRRIALGETHPDTLSSMYYLAALHLL